MSVDTEALAAKLTKAQRACVERGYAWSTVTARKMLELRLASLWARQTGDNWVRIEWTDLGVKVREILRARTKP